MRGREGSFLEGSDDVVSPWNGCVVEGALVSEKGDLSLDSVFGDMSATYGVGTVALGQAHRYLMLHVEQPAGLQRLEVN